MIWQCYIATVVNHGERKKKKREKNKNQHSFILHSKTSFTNKDKKIIFLNINEQNSSVLV